MHQIGRIVFARHFDQWDKLLGTLLLEQQAIDIDVSHLGQACSVKNSLGGRCVQREYDAQSLSKVLTMGLRAKALTDASDHPVQLALG